MLLVLNVGVADRLTVVDGQSQLSFDQNRNFNDYCYSV